MNHTPNYDLNQWSRDDRILMDDFNADNAKIDGALGAKCEIVTGSYVGDGEATREIVLGRRPKAVYVCSHLGSTHASRDYYGGLALSDSRLYYDERSILAVTDNGFTVHYIPLATDSRINTNRYGMPYNYIAFF